MQEPTKVEQTTSEVETMPGQLKKTSKQQENKKAVPALVRI